MTMMLLMMMMMMMLMMMMMMMMMMIAMHKSACGGQWRRQWVGSSAETA